MPYWRIRLLGGLSASHGESHITRFSTQQTAGLLAYLAYHLGQWQDREVLVELLWPGLAEGRGRARLNTAIHTLRQVLDRDGTAHDPAVLTDREHVRLSSLAVSTDVGEFRELAATDPLAAVRVWGGPLLPGCYYDWIAAEREALTDELLRALRRAVQGLLEADQAEQALAVAWTGVQADPLREEAHVLVIRAALDSGAPGLATRQYHEMARLLDQELGLAPSFRLDDLAGQQVAGELLPATPPPRIERTGGPHTTTVLTAAGHGHWRPEELVQAHRGQLLGRVDGTVTACFNTARDALDCAAALAEYGLGVGLHTTDGGPTHAACERATALATTVDGGLILSTEATAALLDQEAADAVCALPVGNYRLAPGRPPEMVYQLLAAGSDGPLTEPLRLPRAVLGSVPVTPTRFFGREAELALLRDCFADQPPCLVTITGPGGSGKSRLAAEFGRLWLAERKTPAWFVPLASQTDTEQVARQVLDTVLPSGLPGGDALERLAFELRRHDGLLILDNLEQLPATVSGLLLRLREYVPRLRCLLTSRHALGYVAEVEHALAPLALGAATTDPLVLSRSPAVALFADRARSALPSFALTARNALAVRQLCERLEGLPLAIELAAARVQTRTPAALLAQFDVHLDWPAHPRTTAPARHRTMRAALQWSLDLLPAPLRRFLLALGSFRGPFLAETAAAASGEPLAAEYLAQLRTWSLVVCQPTEQEVRWRLLAVVRDFVGEQLSPDEAAQVQAGHSAAVLERALAWSSDTSDGLAEFADLQAAVDWGLVHDPSETLHRVLLTVPWWSAAGRWPELCEVLAALLAATPLDHPDRGRALLCLGRLAVQTWHQDRARDVLEAAAAWFGTTDDSISLLHAIWGAAVVAGQRQAWTDLARWVQEGTALAARLDGLPARLMGQDLAGMAFFFGPEWRAAQPHLEAALELAEQSGDPDTVTTHAALLMALFFHRGDLAFAEAVATRVPDEFWRTSGSMAADMYRINLGAVRAARGELADAAALLAATGAAQARAHTEQQATVVAILAILLQQLGDHAGAVAWLHASRRLYAEFGMPAIWLPLAGSVERVDRACRARLSPAAIRRAEADGDRFTALDLAETLAGLPARCAPAGRP